MERPKFTSEITEFSLDHDSTRIICNWWVTLTREQERKLGMSTSYSRHEDWAVIKRTDLFELAFDYEEGYKFETFTPEGVKAIVDFVYNNQVFEMEEGSLEFSFTNSEHYTLEMYNKFFVVNGLKQSEEFSFEWIR